MVCLITYFLDWPGSDISALASGLISGDDWGIYVQSNLIILNISISIVISWFQINERNDREKKSYAQMFK